MSSMAEPGNGSLNYPLRFAAVAGILAAAILFVNAGKRAGFIPLSPFTQLIAPLAQAFAIVLIIGIAQVALRKAGRFSAVAVGMNLVGLSAATGTEWVINLVFAQLDASHITALRSGPLGTAFLVASVVFLAGSLLFCIALFRDETAPRIPTVAYALAAIPIGFRNLVPEVILDLGLIILAASVLWLALWLVTGPSPANAPKDQAKYTILTKQP
ncbi:hypothetical protein QFZ79_003361 [Arthrobacter sp. V4I6]|uniref:hypothetical protein n=1 Tax=unclassified Arthrobacter TaxID=235627 RepID=UPI002784D8C5|nr:MULTISPECIES: hypothetical protein [unclassified Arthrobacter]MDQ0820989.1 hypothetical protein [Arthrobacter sp. V1I7]MDQ0855250.1 hypothetical protein [Arthrobacter sp. V4I6]